MFEVQTSSGMLRNTDSGNPMVPIGQSPTSTPPPPPPAHSLSSSFGLLRSNVTESGSKSFVVHVCQLANCTILGVSDVNVAAYTCLCDAASLAAMCDEQSNGYLALTAPNSVLSYRQA